MIETFRRIIAQIEEEIGELTGECAKLEEAQDRANQSNQLLAGRDEMLQSVKRVRGLNAGLRILDSYEKEMSSVITGNQMESAFDGIKELLKDIENEKLQKRDRISRLKEKLRDAWEQLESLLCRGDDNA